MVVSTWRALGVLHRTSGSCPPRGLALHAALHMPFQQDHQVSVGNTRQFSTSQSLHASSASNSPGLFDVVAMLFSPSQLGASTLEVFHSTTGLPWWASIPATAITARAALLPLSIKAKKASGNLQLLNTAFEQAKLLTLDMNPKESQAFGRLSLIRVMYRHLQQRHKLPSLRWYWANAAAQTTVLMSFTWALGAMSSALWPGLPEGGPPGLRDLTSPPVYLGTFSTPFGTMGAVVPLAIVLMYVRAVDASNTARIPGIGVAMRLMAIPYYCVALLQPNAILLYWLAHTATSTVLQSWQPSGSLTSTTVPLDVIQPGPTQGEVMGRLDSELLLALGTHYAQQASRGGAKGEEADQARLAAVLCYERAVRALKAVRQEGSGAGSEGQAGSTVVNVELSERVAAAEQLLEEAKQALQHGQTETSIV